MLNMIWYMNERCKMHMYMRSPTQTQRGKTTPCSPRKREKVDWPKGFVKISANYFWVGTWIKSMFPFSTLSLRKWYLTSIFLVMECSTRFFGNANGTSTITHVRNMGALLTKVTQSIDDPEQLGTRTNNSYILSLCGRLSCTWLFTRWPRNQQETQELTISEVDFLSTRHPAN
jgi:hypothetical protein